jgi:membrane associated rhomboid family serine protease
MLNNLSPVVKNLLIINVIFYFASRFLGLEGVLAGYYPSAPQFQPWQVLTHMFMHGNLSHIFFNMFALYMFGPNLERVWGSKRFLNYYLICGLGAFALHEFVVGYQFYQDFGTFFPTADIVAQGFTGQMRASILYQTFVPVVGASGAVFGILLGFGMLFPNTRLMLLFPPIPIKAKLFVIGYGAIEIFLALENNPGDNVAHFAHLGGMIFGYIMIKKWKGERETFY